MQPMPLPPLALTLVPHQPPDAEAQNIPLSPEVLPRHPPLALTYVRSKRERATTYKRFLVSNGKASLELRPCCICEKRLVQRNKCRRCTRHCERVYYWKRKLDSGFTHAWNIISQDRKTQFIKRSTGLTTDGLKNRMTLFLAKEMGSMRTTSDFGTGQLDRYKRKYTDKLKQLKALPEPGVQLGPSAGLDEFCRRWGEKVRRLREGWLQDEDTEHQSGVEAVESHPVRAIPLKSSTRKQKDLTIACSFLRPRQID